jgi:hypothetical protein
VASGKGKRKRDGAVILPFGLPRPLALVQIRELVAADKYIVVNHAREGMAERDITMAQVMRALEGGQIDEGPSKDEHGEWRCRLRKRVAGRLVRVVVAFQPGNFLYVISVH